MNEPDPLLLHEGIRTAQATFLKVALIAKDRGTEAARRSALRVTDDLLATSTRRSGLRLACTTGCSWCCYLQVAASVPEILGLIAYLKDTLEASEFSEFEARVRDTAKTVAALTTDQHIHTNIPCPVLRDGRCQAYAARPLKCRIFHSCNAGQCEASYIEPDRDDIVIPRIMSREIQGDCALDAYLAALAVSGYDSARYELVTALAEVLEDRSVIDARLEGKEATVFRKAILLAPAKSADELPKF